MDEVAGSLGLGSPYHVGVAVFDLDDGMRRFRELIADQHFETLAADVPAVYRGESSVAGIRSAFARFGDMIVELVQPTGGRFTAQTFLDEQGEGLYHLGYEVEDVQAAIDRAAALGIGLDWVFSGDKGPLAAYLDRKETLGIHIELVAPPMVRLVESMLGPNDPA